VPDLPGHGASAPEAGAISEKALADINGVRQGKILAFGKGTFTHTSYRFATPTTSTPT